MFDADAELSWLAQALTRDRMLRLRVMARQAAEFPRGAMKMHSDIECALSTDANVLIAGGDASSRTALARLIHRRSKRSHGSWVVLSETPTDRAAADHGEKALVSKAPGGTLFIEELTALDGQTQDELLHLLDTGTKWTDGTAVRETRIISATAHNVLEGLASKRLNARLFYRLNIIHITLADESRSRSVSVH
jgi:DNA-binding NtrC family response regulator